MSYSHTHHTYLYILCNVYMYTVHLIHLHTNKQLHHILHWYLNIKCITIYIYIFVFRPIRTLFTMFFEIFHINKLIQSDFVIFSWPGDFLIQKYITVASYDAEYLRGFSNSVAAIFEAIPGIPQLLWDLYTSSSIHFILCLIHLSPLSFSILIPLSFLYGRNIDF